MSHHEDDPDQVQGISERQERRAAGNDIFFSEQFEETPHIIRPGQVLCGDDIKDMYVAAVGSGVIATMYDVELKLGGMCYVLLPRELLKAFPHFEKADKKWQSLAVEPLERCIAEMKKRGAGKSRIQMRLIGGGKIPGTEAEDLGTKNYVFVREYVTRKGLRILNEDLAGKYARRVHFFPATGRTVRVVLRRAEDISAIQALEKEKPE
jgi:chemotaxis protein CheD